MESAHRPVSNVQCPRCGRAVLVEDVNMASMFAKCRSCAYLFRADDALGPGAPMWGGAPGRFPLVAPEPSVFKPERFTTTGDVPLATHQGYRESAMARRSPLTIQWRWYSPSVLMQVGFCVVWDGFLAFWYSSGLRNHAPWVMLLFPLLHVAVGVFLTFSTLQKLLNRSVVTVDGERLRCVSSPMPFSPNFAIAREQIVQITVEERRSTRRNGGSTLTYEVKVLDRSGKARRLASFDDAREAMYVERIVKERLGLVDQAMWNT